MTKNEITNISIKITDDLITDSQTKKSEFFSLYKSLLNKYEIDNKYYNIILINVVHQISLRDLIFNNFDKLEFLQWYEWHRRDSQV